MAYKITQHRRGTYEEWSTLNPVPYEGELIIVEFDDNICKCKIGNGQVSFLELPYITDWLTADLLNEIALLQENTTKTLDEEVLKLYRKIDEVLLVTTNDTAAIRAEVSEQVTKLTSDIEKLSDEIATVDGVVSALVNPAVGALDTKYSKELASIVATHAEDKESIYTAIADTTKAFTVAITDAVDATNANTASCIFDVKEELAADYTEKLNEVSEQVDTLTASVDNKLADYAAELDEIKSDITTISDSLTDTIDEKLLVYDKVTAAQLREIVLALRQTTAEVEQIKLNIEAREQATEQFDIKAFSNETDSIIAIAERLDDLQHKVLLLEASNVTIVTDLQKVNTEVSTLAAAVTGLSNQQKVSINNLTNAVNLLDEKLSKADVALNTTLTTHISNVNNEIAKLVAADALLYQVVYRIQDTLLDKIEALRTELHTELSDDISRINKTVADSKIRLDKQIAQAQSTLADSVAAAKAELTKKVSTLESQYETRFTVLDTAIAALNTSVSAGQSNVNSVIDNLVTEVTNNTTNITNSLLTLNRLSTTLDNNIAIINAELDAVNTKIDTQLTASENRLQVQLTATDAAVQKQSADLRKLKDNVDDLLEDLDNKITDKILENKSETDGQIASIEETIRQINVTLESLSATTPNANISEVLTTLTAQLADLSSKVDSITRTNSTTNTELAEVKKSVTQVAASVATAVDTHKTDITNIAKSVSTLDKQLTKNTADLTNKLNASLIDINDDLVGLNAQNVTLYQFIHKATDDLVAKLNKLDTETKQEINHKISITNDNITVAKETAASDLAKVQSNLSDRINAVDTKATTATTTLERVIFSKTAENAKAIDEVAATNNVTATSLRREISTIASDVQSAKAGINTANAAVNRVTTTLNDTTDMLKSNMNLLDSRMDAQEQRLSSMIALGEGSTTGDAELADIRVGFDGKTHKTAGDAVRDIGNNVQSLRNSLSQYIDTQAVDGLHYDYAGEVGLMQPYMLYLTAGDEIIQESGVQIISGGSGGGGGGGGSSSLKIGYITPSPMVVTPSDTAIIKFTFSGTDSSGDTILQASASWKVNGLTVANSIVKAGDNEFDITKYLTTGTTKVLLTVTDDTNSVVTKSWNVQQIELKIESDFDDKHWYSANDEAIIFSYKPTGAVDKTVVFKLDGEEIGRESLSKEISGDEVYFELAARAHGSYLLDVYIEADINGDTVESNHIVKDILWYDKNSTTPIIGVSKQQLEVKQYSTTNIVYTVYDPTDDTPNVTIKIDGVTALTTEVKPNKDYNDSLTAIYPYTATTAGAHTITICCGTTEKLIRVFVEDIGINIAPVTTGLAFDFNPAGKSKNDRTWSYNNINLSVSDNFDWVNGGYIPDDPDGPCFCIKAGSSATIDYKLFANEAKATGKEFKFVFKTKNVASTNAVFLSCIDNTTDRDHIGVTMGVHQANIYAKDSNLELAYSENDVIEFEFNISKSTEAVPMVMGYEDGVPSRPMVYTNSSSFAQNTPKVITLGSPDCDVYIYRFKVYNTSLSAQNILNNFIADARTADEMVDRYTRNQIYDENKKLTAEALAEKCPWLRVYKVSAPRFTSSKSDKISDTTIQQIYHGGDAILDNWIAHNSQHSGQGTSSNNYGAAGRNLDFIMNGDDAYFELGDGTTITNEITMTRQSVPVAYLNAKVNIASSNNLTNALLANRYNKFNPYDRPFVARSSSNKYYDKNANGELVQRTDIPNEYIKDTMEFYNCVIFIQETDPDLSTHREFADTDWHFYAIGNIGDSKKTDKTRLTDPSDPYECCVEIMDVDLDLSAFPRDTMINAMAYTEEKGYIWAKDSNLDILYEKQDDGTYVLTADQTVDLNKTYYVDILEHDDFSEDYTYGWRYISNKKDANVVSACKQAWIDFYRFVTTSSDEEFKANLHNYFVVDSALYYYLFTTRYCMVDNRAKNTFWHYGIAGKFNENGEQLFDANGKPIIETDADGNPVRKWDLCWDYDNDTSLGLNNFGKQLYRYGLEDVDVDTAGKEVFRQSNSLFFCRIRDLFAAELKKMYQDLESLDAWNASALINICDAWQSEFPEELWRLDIERKYIRTYNKSFIDGAGDSQFLVNMANGRMKYHRRQWERGQEQYMASKYQTTTSLGDKYHANFRVSKFADGETDDFVIPTNYQFTLTPYSYIYLNVYYNTGSTISVRVTDQNINTPVPVPYNRDKADIINVGSASAIRDFGDLAPLYADTVSVANATRVRRLKIGDKTTGYRNAGFSSLTIGDNSLLEELDITNITGYKTSIDLRELINLKKFYAAGTAIPSALFATGGKLEEVELPAVNDISLRDLQYLTSDKFTVAVDKNGYMSSVVDLTVENCPHIDQLSLFELCPNVNKVKLDNITFGTKTYDYFVNKVFKLKGIDQGTEEAQLTGTVHFENLDGAQFNELKRRYPKLTVTYDTLTSVIKFMDTDLETIIHEQTITNAGDCEDPVVSLGKEVTAKPASDEFTYEWFGWSTTPETTVNYENSENAEADEAADYKKYREDSIAHVEGDIVLYPVFKAVRNSYEVRFINPTDNNKVLYSVMVPYGSDAIYEGETPKKQDVLSASLYSFIGWSPSPTCIVGELSCYAQFAVLDTTWYTINLLDLTDCTDYSGNVFDGYGLDFGTKTMEITSCKNKLNKAVKIPNTMTVDNVVYTIISVGGFKENHNMELLSLPESLESIQSRGFESCYYLTEVNLPESLSTISSYAFKGCSSIASIYIPRSVRAIGDAAFAECTGMHTIEVAADNPMYHTLQNNRILVETKTGKIIQCLPGSAITADMGSHIKSLG